MSGACFATLCQFLWRWCVRWCQAIGDNVDYCLFGGHATAYGECEYLMESMREQYTGASNAGKPIMLTESEVLRNIKEIQAAAEAVRRAEVALDDEGFPEPDYVY